MTILSVTTCGRLGYDPSSQGAESLNDAGTKNILANLRSIGTNSSELFSGLARFTAGSTTVNFNDNVPIPTIGPGDEMRSGNQTYYLREVSSTSATLQTQALVSEEVPVTIYRAFTNVASWADATNGNLVTEQRKEYGMLYSDSPFLLSSPRYLDSSTTDANYYRALIAAPGHHHNGVAGAGVSFVDEGAGQCLQVRDNFTRIQGLEFSGCNSSSGAAAIVVSGAQDVLLEQLLIHDFRESTNGFTTYGVRSSQRAGCSFTVRNSMFYAGDAAAVLVSHADCRATVEHCTIYDMTEKGILVSDGVLSVSNTISIADGTGSDFADSGTGRYIFDGNNISGDTSAIGGMTNQSAGSHLVSIVPGSENLHLHSGSSAIGNAIDSSLGIDIDGDARPAGPGSDVGADEYAP